MVLNLVHGRFILVVLSIDLNELYCVMLYIYVVPYYYLLYDTGMWYFEEMKPTVFVMLFLCMKKVME